MGRSVAIILFFLSFIAFPKISRSQQNNDFVELPDSVREKEHSPGKATLMSACIPGLGQLYNKKYWKIPVVYAGFAVFGYFIYTNTDEYINFKCAYIESSRGNYNGAYSYLTQRYSADELLSGREYYRRNLEISILFTAVWYGLNILDATVDAHLYTYNISDQLSLKVEPHLFKQELTRQTIPGLSLKFSF